MRLEHCGVLSARQHSAMRFLAILAVLLLLSACGDGLSRGIVITGDGKVGANNARNQRESCQETLRIAIEDDLGIGWTARVAIDELPVWVESRSGGDGDWRWERMTARVEVIAPAGAALAEAKRDELDTDSRKYLLRKLVRQDPTLLAFTFRSGAALPAQPVVAANPGQRSYILQAGDTLADISTAFYGSPQHWRALLAANPGLDPTAMRPGTAIVVPPLPAP